MSAQSPMTHSKASADRLGGTITIGGDMTVHRLGFGAMRLCGPGVWGEPLDPSAAKRVLTHAVELGITLIDTADAYGPEVNERFIAETLYPYPEGLVVATKGGLTRPRREAWDRNGRPEHLRAACEGSLRRLRLERIDLYQLHAPDPRVPLEDSVGALADLQAAGKIRHIGLSNVSIDELRRAQRIVPIVSVQNRYNVSDRASEEVLAACEKEGIAFLPWYPAGRRQPRLRWRCARPRRAPPQRDASPSRDRLAACPLARDGANSRHCFGGASRRERCRREHPPVDRGSERVVLMRP